MATNSSTLELIISAKDEASRTLKQVGKEIDKVKKTGSSFTKAFSFELGLLSKAFKVVAIGATAFAGTLAGLGLHAIKNGKDLTRLNVQVGVLAKNLDVSEKQIEEWTQALEESNTRGINAQRVLVRFMQSGLADLGVDFKRFTKTAKEFGASVGVSSGQAIDDFTQAILTNDRAMLQKYGITRSLIDVYEEYGQSIKKAGSDLSEEEKKLAIINQIYKDGDKILGTYAATYGTLSKNLSSLKDAYTNISASIGQVLEQPVTVFTDRLVKELKNVQLWLIANEDTLKGFGNTLKVFAEQALENAIVKVKEWYVEIGGAQGLKAKLLEVWGVIKNDIIPAIISLAKGVVAVTSFIAEHRKGILILIGAFEALKVVWFIVQAFTALKGVLVALTAPFVAIPALIVAMTVIAVKLNQALEGSGFWITTLRMAVMALFGPIGFIIEMINNWRDHWDRLTASFQTFLSFIVSGLATLKTVFTTVFTFAKNLVTSFWTAWLEAWNKIVEIAVEAISRLWRYYKNTFYIMKFLFLEVLKLMGIDLEKWFIKFKEFLAILIETWTEIWNVAMEIFRETWKDIRSIMKGAWKVISNIFRSIVSTAKKAWNSVKSALSGPINSVKSYFKSAYSTAKSIFNGIKSSASEAAKKMKGAFDDAIDDVKGWFKDLRDDAREYLNDIIEKMNKIPGVDIGKIKADQFGGSVPAGSPRIVGEHRPEVFVPSQSGNIRQLDQAGGGTTTVNFNNVTVRNDDDLQAIITAVKNSLSRDSKFNKAGLST